MPDDRMLHRCQGHSAKLAQCDHLTYRVWAQYLLSADDYGVMADSAAKVRGDNYALAKEPEETIAAALSALKEIGLVVPFEHQGGPYLCSITWQDFQHIRHPRNTFEPMPPPEVLRKCSADTRELFRKHPANLRTMQGGKGRVSPRLTANGKRLTAEAEPEGGAGETEDLTPETLLAEWHEAVAATDFPKPPKVTATVRKHAAARLAEHDAIEWWRAYFARIVASDFMCGRSPRKSSHESWRPTLEWVLLPENMAKILAGNYDNRAGPEVFAAAELAKADEHLRRAYGGRCPHDPTCETREECKRNLIRHWRGDLA